ncbi:MAG: lysine--tRNA ligase [Parachlamydiales bacterium]|jgi:lysyl-tRNA synthetase class 2
MSSPTHTTSSNTPEYLTHEEYQNRSRKLAELRSLGIEPYPNQFNPTLTLEEVRKQYESQPLGHSEEAAAGTTPTVKIAGRLILFRSMGKNAFAHIQDDHTRIQIMFNNEHTHLEGYTPQTAPDGQNVVSAYKVIEKKIDLGDIIGIEGNLFFTNKGELTLYAKKVTLLCKTLLPLADKHSGLTDKELRYRKRWLDLITNPEIHQVFRVRSQILSLIRQYMSDQRFMEVETPVLQSTYGGAEARPFTTKLNALNQEMFLRISLEIPLKKLLIGGIERVFEMGKVFRNEGIDRSHNPEFTLLEAYAAYWDYNDMMAFVENLYQMLALKLFGTTELQVPLPGKDEFVTIDVKAPWKRMSMKESLRHYAQLDVDSLSDEALHRLLADSGEIDPKKINSLSRGLMIAALFEIHVEKHLIQPHHITDHPIETTPLCKLHRDPEQRMQGIVERFESFILCGEACNSYTELNDPELQRSLFDEQTRRRDKGDEEAAPSDEEFLEAICQGMPPAGGVGIGIDRLVMLFTQAHSIRDVLFFPWMKPQTE